MNTPTSSLERESTLKKLEALRLKFMGQLLEDHGLDAILSQKLTLIFGNEANMKDWNPDELLNSIDIN